MDDIETMLSEVDTGYSLRRSEFAFEQIADVFYDGAAIGYVEINETADEIFEDDLSAFRDMIGEPKTDVERNVLEMLDKANYMIAVEALWEGAESENTLAKFDPLWAWLFETHSGILQADNEGFYDAKGLILERKFML
ncbi:MAG: hypothetical protein R3E39_03835 [Anaerolineae bacterium]